MSLTNSCRLIGYCASIPTFTHTRLGKPMAKVAVYTKDLGAGASFCSPGQKDSYHWCVFFGKNAERAKELLMKGSQVHINGTLRYMHKIHLGKSFYMTQIWVDEFMLSSRAMMTKELYDKIFPELIVPYQVNITLKEQSFAVNIVTKLSELNSNLSEQEINDFTIEFTIQNEEFASKQPVKIIFGKDKQYLYKITRNKYIKIFYVKAIPFSDEFTKEGLLNAKVMISILIGEKGLFKCDYSFRDLLDTEVCKHEES